METLDYKLLMRIISTRTLRAFYEQPDQLRAEQPCKTWIAATKAASWANPMDVKATFNSADVLKGNRVIFDLGGNKYRVIAEIHYKSKIVFVRFVGTHDEYEDIDPNTI